MGLTLEQLDAATMVAAARVYRPADLYRPHAGQRRFHAAKHKIRCLFPGNRWGKTTALGVEVNALVRTASPAAQILWFCKDLSQFDLLRPQLEAHCFDRTWTWNGQDHYYKWENGAVLKVVPGDRDWKYIQGTNPDLILVDEECPYSLWNELQARGFGDRDTRYAVAATATSGAESWMRETLYEPWLRFHAERGLDEDGAIEAQLHPEIWCLPKGGIGDNPSLAPKVQSFRALQWRGADKEWAVRNFGGFQAWASDPIFPAEDLEWLKARRKELEAQHGSGAEGLLEIRGPATVSA